MAIKLPKPATKSALPPFRRPGDALTRSFEETPVVSRNAAKGELKVDPRILAINPPVSDKAAVLLDLVRVGYEGQNTALKKGVEVIPTEVGDILGIGVDEARELRDALLAKGLLAPCASGMGGTDGYRPVLPKLAA